ncbi:uncharacterized protein J4E79_001873 [Alternaria viburni]|uniref:uncharacterized protein n=1 Tax=Alternaria viburni TaxID=566460 RepID=UPI0020C2E6BD|nr:uncharacterized protein J4E79_001873 [Alternaria viburni]KAI4667188.1 hypothetical protein J4E79_001873 [Alternaria viburni]
MHPQVRQDEASCDINQLKIDGDVYNHGEEAGTRKERLLLDRRHSVYTSARAGHTVVVASYSQLQHLKDTESARGQRHKLFLRIILDEAQCIRGCDRTRQGKILMSFDAYFKAVFTGSSVVDTILDFDGYLAFLEFVGWGWVADLNSTHSTDKVRESRYDQFNESLATGVNNRSEPLEDWHSDCSSVDELDAQQIKESIEDGWQCSHWPALIRYNGDRPQSLDRNDRKKIDGKTIVKDVSPPVQESPNDSSCGEALTIADDLAAYNEREDRYQREFAEHFEAVSLAKSAKVKDSKTDLAKIGSKFAKLSVLCTHIGFSGLDKMSTAAIRAQRHEILPLLTARMKTAGALNPEDIDRPLDSDEEVLRQFLWGSPRMKYLLWEIQRVIFGNTKVASHRKIFATFQFPRSAEMFLKLVEFLGICAVLLDTNMPPEERHKNIRAFDEEDMPQILITTYALNIAGHDAQHQEEVEIVRLFTEGTYQELHEAGMIKKANSMFAAFGELQSASESLEDRENMTTEEIAKGAFGIVRDRVRGRDDKDVQSAKEDAITKAKGKARVPKLQLELLGYQLYNKG